ncbi:MAG: hypothetical protein A3A97_03660 [Candidatus Terrybacteria bacterium RIFCSPLOWO2_01_FULL_40_23]|uniref:GIY-YIG domain-containing protein n=1 Tax=Candidatus Terrybacteria bacterium RIFCSPLOWO2_01_FULL_40_23 TaxID=1802366 RepID=A0A1G2PT88_9BACT|nr:MAG: hypothetical protein A3A97_03660 [Candidatus Terrybacteria bacterium RIFCSPLOWO2_01_FULL_40_23]
MWHTYVLISLKDENFYIGLTTDINRRIKEHNSGKTKSLYNRRPLKLIHKENFLTEIEAKKREQFLKSGQGRKWLRSHLSA